MSLSGQQRKQLEATLVDAFPRKVLLERMLSYGLDKNLDAIAGGDNLQEITFKLIQTAVSQGWIKDLVRTARDFNLGHVQLRDIAKELLPNHESKNSSVLKKIEQDRIQAENINIDKFLPDGFQKLENSFLDIENKRKECHLLEIPEANWSLITQGNYIERDIQTELLYQTKNLATFEGISILLIKGEPGAGKTAIMYWLAYELFKENYLIIFPSFKSNEEESGWLEQLHIFSEKILNKHFYIIIDDIFRNLSIIKELKEKESNPFPITLIGTTRLNEDKQNNLNKSSGFRIKEWKINNPTEQEKKRIFNKIREDTDGQSRLDALGESKLQKLQEHDAPMLVLMLEISQGKPFTQIIADVIKRLPNKPDKPVYKVYEVICSFGQYGIHVAQEIMPLCLSNFSDYDAVEEIIYRAETYYLSGLIKKIETRFEYDALMVTHEIIAEYAINKVHYDPIEGENLPYKPKSFRKYLEIVFKNIDKYNTSHVRWITYCLKTLATTQQKEIIRLVKDILRIHKEQIQVL